MSRRYHKVGSQTTKDAETGPLASQEVKLAKVTFPSRAASNIGNPLVSCKLQLVTRVKISGQGRGNAMRQDVQESPLEESRAVTSAMINETDPYDRPCGALGR